MNLIYDYVPLFTDEETKALKRLSDLPKIIQLIVNTTGKKVNNLFSYFGNCFIEISDVS